MGNTFHYIKVQKQVSKKIYRNLIQICGWFFIALGGVGIFIPLLPTTPFLLLAAFCFLKSSPKTYEWLVNHPRLGKYIINYMEGKGVTLATKIVSLSIMSLTVGTTIIWVNVPGWTIVLLILSAFFAYYYILRLPTYKKEKGKPK